MNPFIYDVVAEAVKAQPWYRKNANTIVAALTVVSSALTLVIGLELDLPPLALAGLPIAVQVIGTFVTKLQTNGIQLSMAERLAATPAATPTRTVPLLDMPHLVNAEISRLHTEAVTRIDEHAPALAAEIERVTGKHRLIE